VVCELDQNRDYNHCPVLMDADCCEGGIGRHLMEAQSAESSGAWMEDSLVLVRAIPQVRSCVPERDLTYEPLSGGLEIREGNHKLAHGTYRDHIQLFALVVVQ
jgi:hypothetical protein